MDIVPFGLIVRIAHTRREAGVSRRCGLPRPAGCGGGRRRATP